MEARDAAMQRAGNYCNPWLQHYHFSLGETDSGQDFTIRNTDDDELKFSIFVIELSRLRTHFDDEPSLMTSPSKYGFY